MKMLKSMVGNSPWLGDWKYCTECRKWTKFELGAHGATCPKCEKKKTEDRKKENKE